MKSGLIYVKLRQQWSFAHSGRPGLRLARPSVAICSFHEPEQLNSKGSSSCLELTAASPSLPVHQSQSVSSRAKTHLFRPAENYWIDWTELNWTDRRTEPFTRCPHDNVYRRSDGFAYIDRKWRLREIIRTSSCYLWHLIRTAPNSSVKAATH